ncbi:centrosomal protein of 112 kDa-like [Macrobrachium rosenbergii]|uniref:centrosomal protein of 112 kDa-like n=1 Tax=Macrobrachium rosenbergii TaxID=79674 RepID=UPI0034D64AB8
MENANENNQCAGLEKNTDKEELSTPQSVDPLKSDEKSENTVNSHHCQDSGLCSMEGSTQRQMCSSKKMKCFSYITSTPKKEVQFLETQTILDDPLLSSIDEVGDNMTDQDVDSITDDESFENTTSRFCKTNITAIPTARDRYTSMTRFMNENSDRQDICETKPSSEIKNEIKLDLLAVKRNLFDIPVSPKLKSRVRQRLYTLVNSIDGYELQKDNEIKQELSSRCEASTSLPDLGSISLSVKPFHKKIRFCRNHHRLDDHVCDRDNDCSCKSLGEKSNRRANLSHFPTKNSEASERCASAVSSVLDSQFQNLHYQQEQISREKSNLMLQKREIDSQISLYKDKLFQTLQMVEELGRKLENSERERLQQNEHFKNKIKQQNKTHAESLSLLQLESEKKTQITEAMVATARLEVTKACDVKIQEVIKSSRERTTIIENMYQEQISQLNSTIAKLQAERRIEHRRDIVEAADNERHLKADLLCITKENEALKSEIDTLKERLAASGNFDQKSVEQQKVISELESKQRMLLIEVSVWREETEKMQKKVLDLENQFKRDTETILEESRKLEQRRMDEMKLRFDQEHNSYKKVIDTMKEKIAKVSLENEKLKGCTSQMEKELQECYVNQDLYNSWEREIASLRTRLRESTSRLIKEKEEHHQLRSRLTKELSELKNQNEKEMMNYRLLMEREKSIALSCAAMNHEEETMAHLRGVENCYQELFKTLQSHFKVQIDEYKKAVRILKLRVKKLEEENVV